MTRGCNGFGLMESIGKCVGALVADGTGRKVGTSEGAAAWRGGRSAERPLPSALRCLSVAVLIFKNLLGQFDIALGTPGAWIIHQDWLAVARCLRQADASRDDGGKDFVAEELLEVIGDLLREVGSLIIHCE